VKCQLEYLLGGSTQDSRKRRVPKPTDVLIEHIIKSIPSGTHNPQAVWRTRCCRGKMAQNERASGCRTSSLAGQQKYVIWLGYSQQMPWQFMPRGMYASSRCYRAECVQ